MSDDLAERILDVVASIPSGSVSTYGDVAARAGSPSPRLAGRVLSDRSDDELPWHRVVRADGTFAPHLAQEQRRRLVEEGVGFRGERVDLSRHRWNG